MTVEIILCSIFTKVLDGARIELVTPGYAVRPVSAVRHVTHCVNIYKSETIPFDGYH